MLYQTLSEIITNPQFLELIHVGGCKPYHREGSAYIHTMMVIQEVSKMFPDNEFMLKVAALHDIGKIFTGIEKADGNWEYPDHAMCGSFRGILSRFIPESDPDFKSIQWFIRNHIRPMFWMSKGFDVLKRDVSQILQQREVENDPDRCTISNLCGFVICDIKGSVSDEPQTALIDYLTELANQ